MGHSLALIPAQYHTSFEDANEDLVPELDDDDIQHFLYNIAAINNHPSAHIEEDDLYRTNYEDDLYVDDIDNDISNTVRFGGKHFNDNDKAENDEQDKDDNEQSSRNILKESSI
jgi:hypothetical protein